MILTPRRFTDGRGWFSETWSRRALAEVGIRLDFVQDNQSYSRATGTVRGLHAQAPPHAQAKLVRVLRGAVLDVAVDARRNSVSFGQWVGVKLSGENARQLLIPEGFLHGFVTLEPETEVAYKCTGFYAPDSECAVRYNDPDLAVDWGIRPAAAVVSESDARASLWRDFVTPFVRSGASW